MTADVLTYPAAHADHGHDATATQTFGFWLYIMTDCVLFASIFATFAVLSHNYAGGPTGKELFNLRYVFGETMFLLFSSVTYGFAVLAMNRDARNQVVAWLIVTFFLGLGFIGMEVNEFTRMILEGNGPDRSGFLSAFFTLVGTHGCHVSSGLLWLLVMMAQVRTLGLRTMVIRRLFCFSLFWHALDLVWIGVFTIVYLGSVHA